MQRLAIAIPLLAGCSVLANLGGSKTPSAPAEPPGPPPIMLRIIPGTVELGLVIHSEDPTLDGKPQVTTTYLNFAFLADSPGEEGGSFELWREGIKVGPCEAMFPAYGHANVGGVRMQPHKRDSDTFHDTWGPPQFERENKTCTVDRPGKYAIRVVPSALAPQPKEPVEIPFELAMVPSTGGTTLELADGSQYGNAAIRRGDEEDYLWFDLGKDEPRLEHLSMWITIPTDMSDMKQAVELAFYAGDERVAAISRDVFASWDHLDGLTRRLDNPQLVVGWPEALTEAVLKSKPGPWRVHVVRNGTYVTTCPFDATKLPAIAVSLRCARENDASVADATRRAPKYPPHDGVKHSLQETRALHRSEEVRRAWRDLAYARNSAGRQGAMSSGFEQQAQNERLSAKERKELKDQSALAAQGSQSAFDLYDVWEAKYERLVKKYGK